MFIVIMQSREAEGNDAEEHPRRDDSPDFAGLRLVFAILDLKH